MIHSIMENRLKFKTSKCIIVILLSNVGNTTTPQWQWNAANNVGFMLNSDMAIYKVPL